MFILENAFENVVCEIKAILSRPQGVIRSQYILILKAWCYGISSDSIGVSECSIQYLANSTSFTQSKVVS